MTNENRCGSKGGRRAKKKLSHPGDEISKFQEVEGGEGDTRCIGTSEIQWAEARNTYLIDHARANHFRIGIDQYLTAQTRAVRPSIYNIKRRGQNLTRLRHGLSFMFLNHSILTMEQDLREIEGKEKEGRRIFFRWIRVDIRGCDVFFFFFLSLRGIYSRKNETENASSMILDQYRRMLLQNVLNFNKLIQY